MKGYFCVSCDKEVPIIVKDGQTMFYCECTGAYSNLAYFREIDDKNVNEIEIHDTLYVNYYEANEIIRSYLSKNIFVSKVVEYTHLDIAMVNSVLYDIFNNEVQ